MADCFIAAGKALLGCEGGYTKGSITVTFEQLFLFAEVTSKTFVFENVADAAEATLREFIFDNHHCIIQSIIECDGLNVKSDRKKDENGNRQPIFF